MKSFKLKNDLKKRKKERKLGQHFGILDKAAVCEAGIPKVSPLPIVLIA